MTTRGIPGIGELAIYDTALRIAAKLRFEPAVVFLHAGTRIGANESFSRAMDVLCICKDRLGKKKSRRVRDCN